jgi:dihydrofolate reductase
MTKIVTDFSMSLDGLITGPNQDLERVHAWMSWGGGATDVTTHMMDAFFKTTGAVVMRRGMWDAVDGPNGWGANGWAGRHASVVACVCRQS